VGLSGTSLTSLAFFGAKSWKCCLPAVASIRLAVPVPWFPTLNLAIMGFLANGC